MECNHHDAPSVQFAELSAMRRDPSSIEPRLIEFLVCIYLFLLISFSFEKKSQSALNGIIMEDSFWIAGRRKFFFAQLIFDQYGLKI